MVLIPITIDNCKLYHGKREDIMNKEHWVSISFGKDSLALLLMMIEKNLPLTGTVFYDTGMEFQAIYDVRDKVYELLQSKGIEYVQLYPERPFLYDMFEKPVCVGKSNEHLGYSWCGGRCRWGTRMKIQALDKFCEQRNAICYIGLAVDEPNRLHKKRKEYKKFPLVEWGITEEQALQYCYNRGWEWLEKDGVELYAVLDRVSCYCCTNKNLKELKAIYQHLPEYWDKLKELQSKTDRPMKGKSGSVFDLEKRFCKELGR